VSAIDPGLHSALSIQLAQWRATLDGGARRVGWKLGMGDRERIGDGPVIGHLTSATQLQDGETYLARDAAALHADAEVAVVVGGGYAAALEIVDLGPPDDPHDIVATNIFHRAVAFGPTHPRLPTDLEGRLLVAGDERAAAPATPDVDALVERVSALLEAMGEELRDGDRIITGSVVQVAIAPGTAVTADFGALGNVSLAIAA
jgi:2-keto-4-pentenoate hydratase